MSAVSADLLPDLQRVFLHFPTYARTMLHIKTKDRRVVPFVLNAEQLIIWAAIEEQIRANEPVRAVILKPRQVGSSTVCQGLTYWGISTNFNTNAIAIAHDADSTAAIFGMSKLMYDSMPIRPLRRYHTRFELSFENESEEARVAVPGLRSSIQIRTAGKASAGRGVTPHIIHGSEVAQWPYPEEIFSGLIQGVPYEPGTMVLLESTAHYDGHFWREFWDECGDPDSQYRRIFIPWFTVSDYELPERVALRYMDVRALDAEEKRLRTQFHLSLGRLAWRRMKVKEMNGDEDMFRQEYPATAEEAFIVGGEPVFNKHRLLMALGQTKAPSGIGTVNAKLDWVPDRKGPLKVWVPPQDGHKYVVGVDAASGEGSDYAAMQVTDLESDEQCALWHGKMEPIALAREVERVARWYAKALVAIEMDKYGMATHMELRNHYNYLYRWRHVDTFVDRLTAKVGWESNIRTKPLLIAHMRHLIEEGSCRIYDRDTIAEAMTFIKTANSGDAAPGEHDDRIMALMIAFMVASQERPKHYSTGGVGLPYQQEDVLPDEVLKDPDAYRKYDFGQHVRERGEAWDWRQM